MGAGPSVEGDWVAKEGEIKRDPLLSLFFRHHPMHPSNNLTNIKGHFECQHGSGCGSGEPLERQR
jgi:hypothetical protein